MNDWSNSKALIGHDLFRTRAWNSHSGDVDKIESRPSSDIGGSSLGWMAEQMHRRPMRRTSEKANAIAVSGVQDVDGLSKLGVKWQALADPKVTNIALAELD